VPFDPANESDGTLAWLNLAGPLIHAITSGATLFVDELDASLHPLLSSQLVGAFNDTRYNQRHGQLIFNTHDTNLLVSAGLRRDQIWFAEKDGQGGSHLYPLSDFKPRKTENLERGYLQGRYGAVPFVNASKFFDLNEESDLQEATEERE
jgi:AAA15 family ATPase/GTPase